MQLAVHVRPGASRASIGGAHDGALVVRVVEPADRGRATAAALRSVAEALGVPHRSVTLVRGATGRRKVVAVDVGTTGLAAVEGRLAALLGPGPATPGRPTPGRPAARHR
ncbi:MAG: DUF167 domain-containing protein [Acidimicrobiales bacterium]